ncbi:unnamed protein product, partial [Adineta steineri]
GKTILEQRSDLEAMFLDALQHVKKQVIQNRLEHNKDNYNTNENRMLNVYHAPEDLTRMRTLSEFNRNGSFQDLHEETKWDNHINGITVNDLTWEQKEQVLRELFIRMNARKTNIIETTIDTEQSTHDDSQIDNTNNIFVTQTDSTIQNQSRSDSRSNISPSGVPKLPQISSPTLT